MRKGRKIVLFLSLLAVIASGVGLATVMFIGDFIVCKGPEEVLVDYMQCISRQEYKEMYKMIDHEGEMSIREEDFIERNANIYEGIEAQNMQVSAIRTEDSKSEITYTCAFDTLAGKIQFENRAYFVKRGFRYKLVWEDSMIFPQLGATDKVQVSFQEAKRGEILDRNGKPLAREGKAASVGLIPMKWENSPERMERFCALLEIDKEEVQEKLSAQWIREDSFVPIKTIPKVGELDLLTVNPDEVAQEEQKRQEELLSIPGVMITDTQVRTYPLGEAAAHLIGYVQAVTAEDLEKHSGEGYTASSVIGKSGLEGLFEDKLKGKNGCKVTIVSANGQEKQTLAQKHAQNGDAIRLTIDGELQQVLYEQFREDKSCSVAVQPYSGEVMALVSTPSYDNNDFILGMSQKVWDSLNLDEKKPFYNRFQQVWCPGSTFKPIVAAIGLDIGAIDPAEDYGNEGLSWQKDSSWGNYYVTTLHAYAPVVLENALMYSDNIYFAKAALKVGPEKFIQSLKHVGFGSGLPFEIQMPDSQFSNSDRMESEIQLADSGYGQGQILINPVHLAALYTAFCNGGNALRPYLTYQDEVTPAVWIFQAFSAETAERVLHGMERVVNDERGTGYSAHREDVLLAGKTGTAEIKASIEDTEGTELGWMAIFTADPSVEKPILLVSMVEDVKERGGSSYVIQKEKVVLEEYLK